MRKSELCSLPQTETGAGELEPNAPLDISRPCNDEVRIGDYG